MLVTTEPSPTTSWSASAGNRFALVFMAFALGGCPSVTSPAGTTTAPAVLLDNVDPLPSALPTAPNHAVHPSEIVGRGLDAASQTCGASDAEAEQGVFGVVENIGTDAYTEAWLRVDQALVFADVVASPSPPAEPVSVRRQARAAERDVGPGELHIFVPGTGDRLQLRLYDANGRMRTDAIAEASWALRDRRAERARTIRPRVLAMLYLVGQHFDAELEIISGYRIAGVNASRGSRHGTGEACDFRVPGVGLRTVQAYVESNFSNIGVGYYPTSGFIHLDQRDTTYYWIDYSGPGERSRTRTRSIDRRGDAATDPTLRSVHVTEQQLYMLPPELRQTGYR